MELTEKERRTLSDFMKIGVERTTHRLEKITRVKWGVMATCINEVRAVNLLAHFQKTDVKCVGAYFHASSMVPLEFLITFPEDGAGALTKTITSPYSERMQEFGDLVSLTIGEVSNFLAQSVMSVIADEYKVMIILKTPEIVVGKKVDLLEVALRGYDGREDTLLVSEVDIFSKDLQANCNMVIIANSQMIHKLASTAKGHH